MVDYYEMGKRVRLRRMENHMTQEQLFELCEVSNNHISSIEKGTHHPSLNLMKNISDSLNTSLDFLVKGDTKRRSVPLDIIERINSYDDDKMKSLIRYMNYLDGLPYK